MASCTQRIGAGVPKRARSTAKSLQTKRSSLFKCKTTRKVQLTFVRVRKSALVNIDFVLLLLSSFFFLLSFFIIHNSITKRRIRTFFIPKHTLTTGEVPFRTQRSIRATVRQLQPQTCIAVTRKYAIFYDSSQLQLTYDQKANLNASFLSKVPPFVPQTTLERSLTTERQKTATRLGAASQRPALHFERAAGIIS